MAFAARSLRVLGARSHSVLTKTPTRGYAAGQLSLTLAAANKTFYDASEVKQVDVPSFSGSFGILADHVPTLAILQPGVITVYENANDVKKIFVSSGTITINEDSSCQVLAEEAHLISDLDADAARSVLSESESALASASTDVAKVEAEIAIEVAKAIIEAAK